jgi:hypothetical protein
MQVQVIVLAMFVTFASLLPTKAARFDFNSQVGVVDATADGKLCLNIANANLIAGTPVSFILLNKPQRTVRATIEEKLAGSCSRDPTTSTDALFYSLKFVGKGIDLSEPMAAAIAVVNSANPLSLKRGIASADLDGDGRTEFFRTCTSNEGEHLTVWSGTPLRGKRRWHSYYYLGYDTAPTCKEKDYR